MQNKNTNELNQRIKEFENKNKKTTPKKINQSALGLGFKISIDFIVPIFVSILIGIGIDKIFFTKPIFFLIFLVLGIITGFYSLYKSVKNLN